MKKTLWLLLGFAPIGFGFVDWTGKSDMLWPVVIPVSAACCFFSVFYALDVYVSEGRIKNSRARIGLCLFLAAALLAVDFCVAFFVVVYVGCTSPQGNRSRIGFLYDVPPRAAALEKPVILSGVPPWKDGGGTESKDL